MKISFRPVFPVALAALVLAALHVGCGDDEATPTSEGADSGAPTNDAAPGTDASTPNGDGGSIKDAAADADADAPTGPTISEDENAPTTLAVGENVTANLAAEKEHFFAFTTGAAGNYTLHFTSPGGKFYASFATVKGGHSCGLPSCVQGTGTAPLTGLAAATTYYLNLYNGLPAAASYTLSVTAD